MDRAWVLAELLSDSGFRRTFSNEVPLFRTVMSKGAYRSKRIAREFVAALTPVGSVEDLVRSVARGRSGLWLYAGWIDQAVLHLGAVLTGGPELYSVMLAQFDEDQVDQGGDMLVGFMFNDRTILCLESRPDERVLDVSLRTDDESEALAVKDITS